MEIQIDNNTDINEQINALNEEIKAEIAKIKEKHSGEIQAIVDEANSDANKIKDDADKKKFSLDIDVTMKDQEFIIGIPEINMKDQDIILALPQVTMKTNNIVVSLPEVVMKTNVSFTIPTMKWVFPPFPQIPYIKWGTKEVKMDTPEVSMRDQNISFDMPEIKIDDTKITLGLPEFKVVDKKIVLKLPEIKVKDFKAEVQVETDKLSEKTKSKSELVKNSINAEVYQYLTIKTQNVFDIITQDLQTKYSSISKQFADVKNSINNKIQEIIGQGISADSPILNQIRAEVNDLPNKEAIATQTISAQIENMAKVREETLAKLKEEFKVA